ncbi:MAG: cob(I)yrinic acid a,c-diamide adenosyltransferase [Thermoanaerobaculales bacterium]|jgi:cob(I)alamin adenosyltransferase|nr:cob(I)yrinic acid a,c-diamide adenosyltransferase [Thermoanaerobaculales bacterium]
MKVYTRKGDAGVTSLLSGGRVRKEDARVEAYGTVDELVSLFGLLRCEPLPDDVEGRLVAIQESLFAVGAALADPEGRMEHDPSTWDAAMLEGWIDTMDREIEPLTAFILPGGSRAAAVAHVARTVCRRAERRVGALVGDGGGVPEGIQAYLNRLSDTLFTLSRFINAHSGISETEWHARR